MLKRYPLGGIGAAIVVLFVLIGIYAPLLASSKPIAVYYHDVLYFPLLRYLFFQGFYTKPLDLFFNLLMFTLPFMVIFWKRPKIFLLILGIQFSLFLWLLMVGIKDPASNPELARKRQEALIQLRQLPNQPHILTWNEELSFMNAYARLNEVTRYILLKNQDLRLHALLQQEHIPTLFSQEKERQREKTERILQYLEENKEAYTKASQLLQKTPAAERTVVEYETQKREEERMQAKKSWLLKEAQAVSWMVMPLIRPFHWEDDAGGEQALNQYLPWWDLTRINRKDLVAALIFGVRISLVVGFLAVGLALLIGIPVGAFSGYYGGVFDIIISRLLEVWESMPTFFMLLLVIAMVQSKSIFIVIGVVGIFGWTGFSRYIRGEFFKQRSLGYVESCKAIGYPDTRIIFKHILPNAIPPLLTLLPFSIMGAITSEAGLSFLGLGEEGSCSWGVLMDEGRSAFPGEAYLLWPPAIFLTLLLISIALIGDALRDRLDPKTRKG